MSSSISPIRALLLALVIAGCSGAAVSTAPSVVPSAAGPGETGPPGTPIPTKDPSAKALLVDTDVAADDLVALSFLVASPQVELVAITVSGTGEAHCAGGVDVVLRLLDRLDAPDLPVACGRETPLEGAHTFPDAWRERVDAGSGLQLDPTTRTPSASTAVELIRALAAEHEPLTILTLGPVTNLAEALKDDPALAGRLEQLYIMGGALHVPGNLVCCGAPEDNDVAEWNIYVDPRALQVVVDSGATPSLVSLDGTNQVPLTSDFARRVMDSTDGAAARVVAELLTANPFMTDGSFYLWDALAAQIAAGYPVGSFKAACVEVELAEGPESGFTRPGCEPANIRYLASVDPKAAEDTLLLVLTGS